MDRAPHADAGGSGGGFFGGGGKSAGIAVVYPFEPFVVSDPGELDLESILTVSGGPRPEDLGRSGMGVCHSVPESSSTIGVCQSVPPSLSHSSPPSVEWLSGVDGVESTVVGSGGGVTVRCGARGCRGGGGGIGGRYDDGFSGGGGGITGSTCLGRSVAVSPPFDWPSSICWKYFRSPPSTVASGERSSVFHEPLVAVEDGSGRGPNRSRVGISALGLLGLAGLRGGVRFELSPGLWCRSCGRSPASPVGARPE